MLADVCRSLERATRQTDPTLKAAAEEVRRELDQAVIERLAGLFESPRPTLSFVAFEILASFQAEACRFSRRGLRATTSTSDSMPQPALMCAASDHEG